MKAFLFDLDGTLVDNVFAHVYAWQLAFAEQDEPADAWRIHARIGMSGEMLPREVAKEAGAPLSDEVAERIHRRHGELYSSLSLAPRALSGAKSIFRELRRREIPHAISTSSHRPALDVSLGALDLPADTTVLDGSAVKVAKPEPDLFLATAERLNIAPDQCYVVGDAVWDMIAARRAGMTPLAVRTGGNCEVELKDAGAQRVYDDVAHIEQALDELLPS